MKYRFKEPWSLAFLDQWEVSDRPGQELFESGDQVGGEAEARAALRDAVRRHGSGCAEALPSLDSLGKMLITTGRAEEGTAVLSEALEISARRLGNLVGVTIGRIQNLGFGELYLGRPHEALKHFQHVRDTWKTLANRDPRYRMSELSAQCMAGVALAEDGRVGEALPILEGAVLALERMDPLPEREGYLRLARENLGMARDLEARGGEPRPGWEALPEKPALGRSSPGTTFLWTREDPGTLGEDPARELREAGDFAGAEARALEALALLPGPGAPGRDRALPLLDSLGRTLALAGRNGEALQYLEESVSVSSRLLGPEHDRTLGRVISMAMAAVVSGRPGEGLAHLERARDVRVKRLGRDDLKTLTARTAVGIALVVCGRADQAVEVFREVLASAERLGPLDRAIVPQARGNLELAEAWLGGSL
ncbi:MAG: tetratricopeptide repeat protein [Deltaproteobacteria bacterium]|nr:tetratricopeptide repeat protein [Deltaproteobacteria bacterium]